MCYKNKMSTRPSNLYVLKSPVMVKSNFDQISKSQFVQGYNTRFKTSFSWGLFVPHPSPTVTEKFPN